MVALPFVTDNLRVIILRIFKYSLNLNTLIAIKLGIILSTHRSLNKLQGEEQEEIYIPLRRCEHWVV